MSHSSLHFACVDVDTATCSDCSTGTCPNPILPTILKEKKLTSGYMGIFSAAKPKGMSVKISLAQLKPSIYHTPFFLHNDNEQRSQGLMLCLTEWSLPDTLIQYETIL